MEERDDKRAVLEQEEDALRERIGQHEAEVGSLLRELKALDHETESLRERNPQFDVLRRVCASLEELDSLDALPLFWGEKDAREAQAERLETARQSMDAFAGEFDQIDSRRNDVLGRIDEQNELLDCLDYDLRDVMEKAEQLRGEWTVEREADPLPNRVLVMPWTRGTEEDRRARQFVGVALAAGLLLSVIVPLVDLPIPEFEELTEVPERVANLIREERTPPPEPEPVYEPPPEEEIEPEPVLAEEEPPEDAPLAVEQPVVAEADPVNTREQVRSRGILAFRNSFAGRASQRTTDGLGSRARVSNAGQNTVGRPERSMVTTSVRGSSGGINLADISRDVGGGGQAIEGVEVAQVASSIGGGDGPDRPLASGYAAGRTDEEIQIVFDRYKAALYRLYNRELRRDPTLRGQIVLRLTIEPDGSVSFCTLQSSEMDAPDLAQQVVTRVSGFDFGAKEGVVAMTIVYPIDFLPAA